MKKNILLILITAIICIGGTTLAYTYNASDIGYRDTNVASAIDGLYTTQNTTVTNLQSQNSSLTTQNTNLTNQVTALQAQVDGINCVKGSFTCDTCNTSSGKVVPGIDFTVNQLLILYENNNAYLGFGYYNSTLGNNIYQYNFDTNDYASSFSKENYLVTNNQLVLKNFGASSSMLIYYIACK